MKIFRKITIILVLSAASFVFAESEAPGQANMPEGLDVNTGLDDISTPAPGTDAAVVQIFVDPRNGYPLVDQKIVIVERGQRVVWVGPDNFIIEFPRGSPFSQSTFPAVDAVVNLLVPKAGKAKAKKLLKKVPKSTPFKYNVIVDGKILDPHFIVIEQ